MMLCFTGFYGVIMYAKYEFCNTFIAIVLLEIIVHGS